MKKYTLYPYKHNGLWVFDDPTTGLDKEAFVAGIDKMLDIMAAGADKLKVVFSDEPLVFQNLVLQHICQGDAGLSEETFTALLGLEREGNGFEQLGGGNWYFAPSLGLAGWLCPALFLYFNPAPKIIYACIYPNSVSQFRIGGGMTNMENVNLDERRQSEN